MDPLLNTFRTMRLSGGIFLEAEFTAPWCVKAKVGPDDCTPFTPNPASIIAYHYVTVGKLLLKASGQSPLEVNAGDLVVLPRNDEHRLGSSLDREAVTADRLIQPGMAGGPARIVHGGGGERTHVLCGFLGSDSKNDPALVLLPAVMKLDVSEGVSGQWIESSLRFAVQEMTAGRFRSELLARLAEILFVEAVQRYVLGLAPEEKGWLAGVRDPVVGRALALLHQGIDRRWTTEELARAAGASRSTFAERFTQAMGEPPMRYLTKRRLHLAARRLAESQAAVARVAIDHGYESEAAFTRAFRRVFGMPPAAWRRKAKQPA